MSVTSDDVRAVASLARLELDGERLQAMVSDLNGILAHMEVLHQVDAGDVADVEHHAMPLRDDAVDPIPLHVAREQFAPLLRDGFFLVPRLSTHGAPGGEQGA